MMTESDKQAAATIEGVPYYRFRVRWTLADGRRRQRTILSPGLPWIREEVRRMLCSEYQAGEVRRNVHIQAL